MSIRFQADNDLNNLIVAAVFRREPAIDFQSARIAQLDYLDDETFLAKGNTSSGSAGDTARPPLPSVVDTLELIWADDRPATWEKRGYCDPVLES